MGMYVRRGLSGSWAGTTGADSVVLRINRCCGSGVAHSCPRRGGGCAGGCAGGCDAGSAATVGCTTLRNKVSRVRPHDSMAKRTASSRDFLIPL
jgi:hypothetical protein